MTYGFKTINTADTIQIDDVYSNYVLHTSGTIDPRATYITPLSADGEGYSYVRINFANTTNPPLIFIQSLPQNYFAQLVRITNTYADIVIVFTSGWWPEIVNVTYFSPLSINYRVYAPVSVASSPTGYGLVVKSPTGAITYNSQRDYMTIAGIFTCPYTNTAYVYDLPTIVQYTSAPGIPTTPFFCINHTIYFHDIYGYSGDYGPSYEDVAVAVNVRAGTIEKMNVSLGVRRGNLMFDFYILNYQSTWPIAQVPTQVIVLAK